MLETGTIKVINHLKGFGFITPMKGREIFFHASGCVVGLTALNTMDTVIFRVVGEGKKRRAIEIEPV